MKKATKRVITLALIAVLLVAVSSFLWVKEEQKEIQFGCALSLSGELEEEGRLTREGYELWKEYVNSQGGIQIGDEKYLIDILYYDDESNPQKTASLVERLIIEDKVDFLLGPYGSSATFEAAAIAERYRVPMVEGEGPAEKIFTQGFKYTFGLLSSSRDYFQNILEGAASLEPKPNRVAILSTDVPYLYIAEGAEQHAKRLGFEVIPIITVEKGDDLSSILSDLKDDSPNMVLFSAPFGEALSFVKTAKAVGLSPNMFGIIVAPCDPAFVEQLGKDADYIFGPCQWTSNLPYDGPVFGSSEDYARLFREKFGKEPEYHSAAATACGVTYQLALEKASSIDHEKVRDALASLDAMTFYGRIKFNEQGRDVYNPMVAIQVQKGKIITVWPEHLATGSAKYPTPPWGEREPKLEVAVLHIGPIGDYGWTYEGHLGAQAMAEELPFVELSEREEACGPDAPQIMREYAEAGNKIIFCHSYNFGEYIEEVAPNHPDVIFMWGAGVDKKAPNAGIYFGRMYESRFLTGVVAGSLTETNNIGYAAALPTSEVVRGIDAFAKGVASVNPDAEVYVEWIGEWYNPPKEKEVALSLIDRGCDIITHHSDSYAPGEAAEERGVYYISFGSDMRRFAPHVFLTGTLWNWTPIMTDVVKAVHNGTWDEHPGQDWWYGLAEGGVKLAPFSDLVPEDVRELVEEKKQAIISGEFEVFPGMTDKELREIYYFESNVVGELPVKETEEAIKIGAIYPLTGSLATSGADVKNGVLLAVDIINNEYNMALPLARSKGIESLGGAKIEIVFGDSQGLPSTGKSEAERLTDKEKVVALIGCYQSAVTAEASQVAEDKGIPFLTATSTAPSLTQQGHLYFFRTTPDDKIFVQNFYEFLQDVQEDKDINVGSLGIVHENSVWGSEFSAGVRQYAEEYGYQIVETISYASDTTNMSSEVQRLKEVHPDIVMQASYLNDAILYMQTYKEMNFSPNAILANDAGFIEPEFLQVLGENGNYILTREVWSNDLAATTPLVGTVNQMFRERYGTDMNGNSARAFTGMLVLTDAINRAGSTNPEAIRKALIETNISSDEIIMPWDGVRFDQETHQNTLGKGIICQIIDQEYCTVWPWTLATKELIWPMPKWEEREPELKVAVLHFGPIEDYGWTYEAHLGAQAMAEALPYVELSERENASGPDSPQILREYAETGYGVIFCHGWDLGIEEVAQDYPDVIFMWGGGDEKKTPNTGIYYGRMYEASFLAGIVAGAMTETNKIGYAASIPIPGVVRGIDAFAKGAASVNPDAKVYVEWIGEWYNPPKEKEVTLSLIDKGCDVITHRSDSYAPAEAAEERGVYFISQYSDMRRFAPHVFLTGTVWNWAPIMTDVVKAVREGTWDEYPSQDWWYGLAEGGVKLAPFSDLVPEDVREMVEEKKQAIIEGEFEVFPGMTDEELREIYYFESNVVGELA